MLETEALKDAKTGQSFRTRHLHSGHNNKGKWGSGVEEDRSYSSTTAQSRPRRQCKNRNAQTHDTKTTSLRSLQLMGCEYYVNDSFRDVVVELCDVLLSNPHLGWAESMFSLASMRMMKNALLLLLRCLLNEEEDRPLSSMHCHPLVRKRDGPRYKPASQGLDFPRTMDQLTIMQTATAGLGVTTISL